MAKKSAGILVYRFHSDEWQMFLVHPGGPFYAKKDAGCWTIPKGEFEDGEEPLVAAKREFTEETGFELKGEFVALTPFKQKGGKTIYAWAHKNDFDAGSLRSNMFEIKWPPGSGRMASFPEIDRGAWFGITMTLEKILEAQKVMIEELRTLLDP